MPYRRNNSFNYYNIFPASRSHNDRPGSSENPRGYHSEERLFNRNIFHNKLIKTKENRTHLRDSPQNIPLEPGGSRWRSQPPNRLCDRGGHLLTSPRV